MSIPLIIIATLVGLFLVRMIFNVVVFVFTLRFIKKNLAVVRSEKGGVEFVEIVS